jgi:hypothetical protein
VCDLCHKPVSCGDEVKDAPGYSHKECYRKWRNLNATLCPTIPTINLITPDQWLEKIDRSPDFSHWRYDRDELKNLIAKIQSQAIIASTLKTTIAHESHTNTTPEKS